MTVSLIKHEGASPTYRRIIAETIANRAKRDIGHDGAYVRVLSEPMIMARLGYVHVVGAMWAEEIETGARVIVGCWAIDGTPYVWASARPVGNINVADPGLYRMLDTVASRKARERESARLASPLAPVSTWR
jgi:hypothetical protein